MDKPNQLFKAFSDETRLRILNLLAQRDHCVCEFQAILRVPQPRISRHLAYLRCSGLVNVSKCGKWAMYGLAKPRNSVHASLLRCIRGCFSHIEFLQRDIERGRRSPRVKCT
jgi:ArsR family transcriptional regulator, arsenate/arsenite/antimonite-responsive transcriptional repressor